MGSNMEWGIPKQKKHVSLDKNVKAGKGQEMRRIQVSEESNKHQKATKVIQPLCISADYTVKILQDMKISQKSYPEGFL